jgi:diguanylate cyclase (GGDEF)-like protein
VSTVLVKFYTQQREETARIILTTLRNDISVLSYTISKNLAIDSTIKSSLAILDKTSLNNRYIDTILVVDDSEVLLTTDPHYKIAPLSPDVYFDKELSIYDNLMIKKGIEGEIRYYKGVNPHTLRLIFLFNHDSIHEHFDENVSDGFIYLTLFPFLILLFSWFISRHLLTIPLEKLRQFAYYRSKVPKAFKIKELEAIRSSMVQTFSRLEEEQKELYDMARTDHLSGLANRNALNEYIKRIIADAVHSNVEFAFLFLDLDHFKSVNDELGHTIGDELLKSVSAKIEGIIPANNFVARVGGDEFVIVLNKYKSLIELTNTIKSIQELIAQPWLVQTNPIHISSSIGIAFYPKDGFDIDTLMQHSNIAMYEAKRKGRAQYHFFTDELNKKVQDTIALDKAMRKALEDDEYELYYQPKTDVVTGHIYGAEALIRWISPEKGIIAPFVFIPLAEENGFIVELGDWILEKAIQQQNIWKQKGLDIKISINVATKQILHPRFEHKLETLLSESMVDTSKINIEITEYLFLEQNQNNLKVLDFIHSKGIEISLDDFGTGYSSLSYLKKFPIDVLKIDKVFMDDYATHEGSVFIETIVKMGQTLKMKIIAEGVEEKEQVAYLKDIGCDAYQGYYCSKPLSVKNFELFYKEYIPKSI